MGPLDADQIAFFKREGYLVLRDVLDEDLMEMAREAVWAEIQQGIDRADPSTWVGPGSSGFRSGVAVGDKPWLVDMLPANPTVAGIAEQLLGKGKVAPLGKSIRGINCNLPFGDKRKHQGIRIDQLHVDAHPFNLGVLAYFDDVEPGAGGFTVHPGSHRRFWKTFELQYDTLRRRADSAYLKEQQHHTAAYHQVREECHAAGKVEITGKAGTVIFWHHRIAHQAGTHHGATIRCAVLHDFHRNDLQESRERPPASDMWLDWSDEVRANAEAAPALDLVQPPAEVQVTLLMSDPGMLAPHQDWQIWELGQLNVNAEQTSAADLHAMVAELAQPYTMGQSYSLQYEYPPRVLPNAPHLSLRDLGAGRVLEVRVRLAESRADLTEHLPPAKPAAAPASAISNRAEGVAEFIVGSAAKGLEVYQINEHGTAVERIGAGVGAAGSSAVPADPGTPGGLTPGYMAVAELPCGRQVVYGTCGTTIVWWTMQYAQASGHLSLDFSGAVKTGETDDVGASHICVDHQGNFIFTANYDITQRGASFSRTGHGTGQGSVSMIAIDSSDGSLGTATEYRFGKGACDGSVGEWKEGARFRQERCHPHGVVCDPINNNLFVADLGSNQVVRWINDTDKGMLHSPLGTTLHPFAGPRHLDFSPDGRMLYVTNELDNTVCVFRHHIDSSTVTLVQTLYSVPLDYLEENLMTRPGNLYSKPSHASELLVTQDGRFVYISNRGHDTIAGFSVDPATGLLTLIQLQESGGRIPWAFTLTGPADSYLVVQNTNTRADLDPSSKGGPDTVTVFARDEKTGVLTKGTSLGFPTVSAVWRTRARL